MRHLTLAFGLFILSSCTPDKDRVSGTYVAAWNTRFDNMYDTGSLPGSLRVVLTITPEKDKDDYLVDRKGIQLRLQRNGDTARKEVANARYIGRFYPAKGLIMGTVISVLKFSDDYSKVWEVGSEEHPYIKQP
jgi:hypothetical protein